MSLRENMDYKKILTKNFRNKKVVVTGHTGFKGSWLSYWLSMFGAKVTGLSDRVISVPSHYSSINLKKKIKNKFFDISNKKKVLEFLKKEKPDFIFHLAAQALVSKSYKNPILTWNSNTIGTINILESLRLIKFKKKCVCVLITSDKSYKNVETNKGYKENDKLGGKDPYSASKAAADIAINSYFNSFYSENRPNLRIGVARAGNVIGGGDWSEDRLIPDCIKNWRVGKTVELRNPHSTRPWQHVLDALNGYINLSINLNNSKKLNGEVFNFGPSKSSNFSVLDVVREIKKNWPDAKFKIKKKKNKKFFESNLLKLNSEKAKKKLKWKSVLNFKEVINFVSLWYLEFLKNEKSDNMTKKQILNYISLLEKRF